MTENDLLKKIEEFYKADSPMYWITKDILDNMIAKIRILHVTRARLKEAEETLEFYADVGRWIRRNESVDLSKTSAAFKGYSEMIETKSWRPAGITICDRGEKARNYFKKYPAKELEQVSMVSLRKIGVSLKLK